MTVEAHALLLMHHCGYVWCVTRWRCYSEVVSTLKGHDVLSGSKLCRLESGYVLCPCPHRTLLKRNLEFRNT